jgi:DNA-directed RNA polymerase specialized sigma24 family protein
MRVDDESAARHGPASAGVFAVPDGRPVGDPARDPFGDDAAVILDSMSDPERFAVLVRRHAPAIQRYVTRRIGREAAEDVVAETFLIAFRQRGYYTGDGRDCLPWLYGIATRLAHRHWRSETRQLNLLARTGIDPVTEPFTDRVDAEVTANAAKTRLAAAVAGCLPASETHSCCWSGPA